MGKISRFGLLELSRQRLRPSLGETSHSPCPRCHGTGHIRGAESTALHILRIIQEEAMKDNTAAVHAQVPVDVATFLLNEKRVDLQLVEARHRVSVTLIPNMHLETPNYSVTRLRHDDLNNAEPLPPSYEMVEVPSDEKTVPEDAQEPAVPRPQAVVRGITPQQPAPVSRRRDIRGSRAGCGGPLDYRKDLRLVPPQAGRASATPDRAGARSSGTSSAAWRRESGRFRSEEREAGRRVKARVVNASRPSHVHAPRRPHRRANSAASVMRRAAGVASSSATSAEASAREATVVLTADNSTRAPRRSSRHRSSPSP